MGVLSGKSGVVNGASTIGRWQIEPLGAEIPPIPASGATNVISATEGNTDWHGWYRAYGHTPASMPGEALAFVGSINGTLGAVGTAIVDTVQIDINLEEADPISHVVQFSSNGALAFGSAAATDATAPAIYPPKSRIITKAVPTSPISGQGWEAVNDTKRMRIVLGAKNPRYVNASTAGIWKRVAGNIFAAASYTAHTASPSEIPTPNTVRGLRIYVTATTYWELDWGIIENVRELGADRLTAEPVLYTLDWRWAAYTAINGTQTQGQILKPGGTAWWPPP